MRRRAVVTGLGAAAALGGAIALWRALPDGAPPKLSEDSPFEGIPEDHDPRFPSRLEARKAFLEAARTDLERPWSTTDPKSRALYSLAARRPRWSLRDVDARDRDGRWTNLDAPAYDVASALLQLDDPEAIEALLAWVTRPSTRPAHRLAVLRVMEASPRMTWLPALRALLESDAVAAELYRDRTPGGFRRTGECKALVSVKVLALRMAAELPESAGPALVREVARDRARSEPDPRTLAAIEAHDGVRRQDPDLSRAVASLRLMALAVLDDPALIRKAAEDPAEPELIRRWAGLMNRPMPMVRKKRRHPVVEGLGPQPLFYDEPACW